MDPYCSLSPYSLPPYPSQLPAQGRVGLRAGPLATRPVLSSADGARQGWSPTDLDAQCVPVPSQAGSAGHKSAGDRSGQCPGQSSLDL